MKYPCRFARVLFPATALALLCAIALPTSAFFWSKKTQAPSVADFSKNGLIGSIFSFSASDFVVEGDSKAALLSITLTSLPDPGAGSLTIGGQPLETGSMLEVTALDGLRFQCSLNPSVEQTSFTFLPAFSSGTEAEEVTVTLYLLTESNQAPIARNMDLSTYKNISITGWFDAMDSDGEALTFQLTSTPARGSVELPADGSSQFVYTPYENKTGKDSFTYVAVDPAGNVSQEAKVSISIDKADTAVTYSDLQGHPAHKAAIRLAEEGIFTGEYVNGHYCFSPDTPVSRSEFLAMAMAVSGLEPLEQVTLTGFYDDAVIPTWAKGYVSAALMAGVIQGSRNEAGQCVFRPQDTITLAQANVMLDNLIGVTDVSAAALGYNTDDWASQATANLVSAGVTCSAAGPAAPLTRGDVAELLDSALDVLAQREDQGGWFS